MRPLLLDLSHTSHTAARTGIQRVARSLLAALGDEARPITFDPYAHAWRPLERWERDNLARDEVAATRGARWPWSRRWRSKVRRWRDGAGRVPTWPDATAGLVVPELFSGRVAVGLPQLLASVAGPRVAIFHDAIALKLPELTPPAMVSRFPAYLQELLAFDGIAAVSEDSRASLLEYWRWLGIYNTPPVYALPLGLDAPPARATTAGSGIDEYISSNLKPVVLSVGSIEGRKNHAALLDACDILWRAGRKFTLRLVGLAQRQSGARALARIAELRAAGRDVVYSGPQSEVALEAAYADCAFTVYPSLMEGFGLPVLESLARGKPCVCSSRGAIGESARGGGCMMVDAPTPELLAAAIGELLENPGRRNQLALAARGREFRPWSVYARELREWMESLSRRNG